MRVQVDFVYWDGSRRPVGTFPSLERARRELGLLALERDPHSDLLDLPRAYSQPVLDGVWLAYPKVHEPPLERVEVREPVAWPRTARRGEMQVLSDGTLVECHVCGEPVTSVGHHARWRHGLSPEEYRERFGLNRQTPLCAPTYSAKCRRRNWRLKLARHIEPYRFTHRPNTLSPPRRLEARRNISEGRREVEPRPRPAPVTEGTLTDWGALFRGR